MPTFLTMMFSRARMLPRPERRGFRNANPRLRGQKTPVGARFIAPSFFLCLFLLLPLSLQAAPTVTVKALPAPHLAAYGLAEWIVTLNQAYANPFDPEEIAIDATFTGPHGQILHLPGFWYEDFRRQDNPDGSETLTAAGKPEWRVRFCPPTPGRWQIVVAAVDASGVGASPALAFSVLPSQAPGFVRRTPNNDRYLQYDNGKAFFPIGENICWSGRAGLQDYDAWFPRLSEAGGNYARLWLANRPLEHGVNGLGRYDLENAWYFDQVFALAAKNGIHCMTALGTYGEFTTGGYFGEGQWPINPYNKINGGPAATPADFWTNPTARALYRRRLRYLIARYGPETSLAFWEFWNETAAPAPWVREMAAYLKANDPYRHLVTNSYSTTGEAAVWNLPQIDLTQTHRYGDEGSVKDITPLILDDARQHDVYSKPHFMGEFGISWRGSDAQFDPQNLGTNLHNGLWAGAFSGNAGGASIWWWDSYVHPKNLYSQFTGLSKFAATIDWPRRHFAPLMLPPLSRAGPAPETFRDLTLNPTAAWGEKASSPVVVHPDGSLTGGPLLSTLFGPAKLESRSVLTLRVTLAKPTTLTIQIGTVSNKANLRVGLDGQTVGEYPFNADPSGGGGYQSTKKFPEYGGIYQALFHADRTLALPAGSHSITLENTDGDWLQIASLTLSKALSSRFIPTRAAALQDKAAGETLLWLQDPDSNWFNDRADRLPSQQTGLRVTLSLPRSGVYSLAWWDTRTGKVIHTQHLTTTAARLSIAVPAFTRDIALHAWLVGERTK